MTIEELTKKVFDATRKDTHEERVRILRDAKVIGRDGHFLKEYFSPETIQKERKTVLKAT